MPDVAVMTGRVFDRLHNGCYVKLQLHVEAKFTQACCITDDDGANFYLWNFKMVATV